MNKNNKLVKSNRSLSLWDEFDNYFDSFFTPSLSRLNWPSSWLVEGVTENDGNFNIELELPGFSKEQIKITVQNNTLKVLARNDKYSFDRSFYHNDWDADKSVAKLENGVLTIVVPKTEVKEVELPPEKVIEIQ